MFITAGQYAKKYEVGRVGTSGKRIDHMVVSERRDTGEKRQAKRSTCIGKAEQSGKQILRTSNLQKRGAWCRTSISIVAATGSSQQKW